MNQRERELSVGIGAGLVGTCTLLVLGFFLGVIYRPIWGVFMWPEIALRSCCNPDTYLAITELAIGRIPPNNTPLGILLGALFWWPVMLMTIMRPSRVGSAIKRFRAPLLAVLAAVSCGLLLVFGALVGARGFAIVVMLGVLMFLGISRWPVCRC